MGTVQVTLTGDEQRLLQALDKVVAKERELGRAAGEVGEKSRKGMESGLDSFRQWDSSLRGLIHLGRGLLGVFGVAGGLAGGISLVVQQIDAARKNAESLGNLTIKMGAEQAKIGKMAGPGGVAAVQKLAGQFGVPREQVSALYAKFIGEGLSPAGAESQTQRALQEAQGGPAAAQRLKETGVLYPGARAAGAKEALTTGADVGLERPATLKAAENIIRGQQAALAQDVENYAAKKTGFESAEKMGGWFGSMSFADQQELVRNRTVGRSMARRKLGFPSLPVGSQAEAEVNIRGLAEEPGLLTAKEEKTLAAELYAGAGRDIKEAAEALKNAGRKPR